MSAAEIFNIKNQDRKGQSLVLKTDLTSAWKLHRKNPNSVYEI